MIIRFFDIFFSFIALIILSPILILIILILKFSGEGEIFFFQERIGLYGNTFNLIKFATMLKNSPQIGSKTITIKDDPRILPIGKLLRKSKINELPQLLNILFGDMSIIGPRPLTKQTFSSYDLKTQIIIKNVKPGLSGVGSLIFHHEEDILIDPQNSLHFYDKIISPYKGNLEKWFVDNNGLLIYFQIIFLTIWVILFSNTKLVWILFKDLPPPPKELSEKLNYQKIK